MSARGRKKRRGLKPRLHPRRQFIVSLTDETTATTTTTTVSERGGLALARELTHSGGARRRKNGARSLARTSCSLGKARANASVVVLRLFFCTRREKARCPLKDDLRLKGERTAVWNHSLTRLLS